MIRVRGTVQRQLFNDPMSGYSVYSIKPYTPYPEGLVISKYGTISISGEIEFRTGTEVDINVILNEESQYEGSYFFCGFGAITMNGDRVHLNETETAQILAQYMTESQVNMSWRLIPTSLIRFSTVKKTKWIIRKSTMSARSVSWNTLTD